MNNDRGNRHYSGLPLFPTDLNPVPACILFPLNHSVGDIIHLCIYKFLEKL